MSLKVPSIEAPRLGEPFLLTPGPLTTSYDAKAAMLKDWGSWDGDFRRMTQQMRDKLIEMLGSGHENFDCVPMQGSGSFSVEAIHDPRYIKSFASFISCPFSDLIVPYWLYFMNFVLFSLM